MSYQPPGSAMHYMPPQPAKTSGAAIASLICGLLLCIPVITQLVAIITGFVGLKAAKQPGVGGRGMAITGLVLGFLGLAGYVLVGLGLAGSAVYVYTASAPMAEDCRAFTADLGSGQVDSALTYCDPTVISKADLESLSAIVQQWGTLQKLSLLSRKKELIGSNWYWSLDGTVIFSDGITRTAEFEMCQQPDGSYKINSVEYR